MGREGYRVAEERHDRWWANFIRSATIRMQMLKNEEKSGQGITWIVYKKGYVMRGKEDGKPYVQYIEDLAKKYGAKLVWVDSSQQIINEINKFAAGANKISSFDYFGHSNPHAFMIDYSADILGASTVWIHESELGKFKPSAFKPNALCNSYGCYTAASMSGYWAGALGIPLYGCTEKTDYSHVSFGRLPEPSSGQWRH